jgi:cytochrome c556
LISGLIFLLVVLTAGAASPGEEEKSNPNIHATNEVITTWEKDPVGYRQLVKKSMEGHLGGMGLIITRKVPHSDHMVVHANALMNLARLHSELYPVGSESPATKAGIWQETEAFKTLMNKTIESTVGLASAIEEDNRHKILNRLVQVGESCESCHDRFRIEVD